MFLVAMLVSNPCSKSLYHFFPIRWRSSIDGSGRFSLWIFCNTFVVNFKESWEAVVEAGRELERNSSAKDVRLGSGAGSGSCDPFKLLLLLIDLPPPLPLLLSSPSTFDRGRFFPVTIIVF